MSTKIQYSALKCCTQGMNSITLDAGCSRMKWQPRAAHSSRSRTVRSTMQLADLTASVSNPSGFTADLPVLDLETHTHVEQTVAKCAKPSGLRHRIQ